MVARIQISYILSRCATAENTVLMTSGFALGQSALYFCCSTPGQDITNTYVWIRTYIYPSYSASTTNPTYIHMHTHTLMYTHTHTHVRTHAHMHTLTHARMYARTHTHTHTYTHACTHAHMHTRMHTCTHAHTRACQR